MKCCLLALVLILGIVDCWATEDMSKVEYRSMSERIGERRTRQMMRNLAPETKRISREDYVNRKLTRGERREVRRNKKQGIYKSPQEEFDLMDKDQDGFVDSKEMNEYYVGRARLRYE